MPTFALAGARAEASRRNGAKSRGPTTHEGKARSAQNALEHGLCAHKHVVLPDEDAAEFAALEAALIEELAPQGALQAMLAQRIAAAAWRLSRAERLEVELFAENGLPGGSLGLALMRDGRGARAFDTLVRYRGGALAEFWRALRTLKALQMAPALQADADALSHQPQRAIAATPHPLAAVFAQQRNEPEPRRNLGDSARPTIRIDGVSGAPEARRAVGMSAPSGAGTERNRAEPSAAALLAATALKPAGGP